MRDRIRKNKNFILDFYCFVLDTISMALRLFYLIYCFKYKTTKERKTIMTTYYESAEGITITRARALLELKRHYVEDLTAFDEEVGVRDYYSAQEVLRWLGY